MSALYSVDMLRLAAGTIDHPRLTDPHATAEARARTCGSRITVDVRLSDDGRIEALGYHVEACVVGQAAATLLGRAAIGRLPDEVADWARHFRAYLSGERDMLPDVAGIDRLAPVRNFGARHDAALLAFDAAAACLRRTDHRAVAA